MIEPERDRYGLLGESDVLARYDSEIADVELLERIDHDSRDEPIEEEHQEYKECK